MKRRGPLAVDARWIDAAVLLLCLACFWTAFWPAVRPLGVGPDEIETGALAARSLEWLKAAAAGIQPGLPLPPPPLIYDWGHGPFNGYLLAPFLAVLGRTFQALHVAAGFFASLTILATYVLGLAFLGRPAALLASILLTLSPGLMAFAVAGAGETNLTSVSFAAVALAALKARARGGGRWLLAASTASISVALGANWAAGGFCVPLVLLAYGWRADLLRGLNPRQRRFWLALCALIAAAHLLPVVRGWQIYRCFDSLRACFVMRVRDGPSPSQTVATRLLELWSLPGGQAAWLWALAAMIGTAANAQRAQRVGLTSLWIVPLVYTALSLFSPSTYAPAQLISLLPVLALLAASPAAVLKGRLRAGMLAAVCLGALTLRSRAPAVPETTVDLVGYLPASALELCRWRGRPENQEKLLVVGREGSAGDLLQFCFPGLGFLILGERELPRPPRFENPALRSARLLSLPEARFLFSAWGAGPVIERLLRRQAQSMGLALVPEAQYRDLNGGVALTIWKSVRRAPSSARNPRKIL